MPPKQAEQGSKTCDELLEELSRRGANLAARTEALDVQMQTCNEQTKVFLDEAKELRSAGVAKEDEAMQRVRTVIQGLQEQLQSLQETKWFLQGEKEEIEQQRVVLRTKKAVEKAWAKGAELLHQSREG